VPNIGSLLSLRLERHSLLLVVQDANDPWVLDALAPERSPGRVSLERKDHSIGGYNHGDTTAVTALRRKYRE